VETVLLPWHWWAFGGVLMILEALLPGFVLIWLGVAAVITGGALWLWPALSLPAQLMLFALAAVGSVFAWFTWRRRNPPSNLSPTLNRRAATLVGAQFDLIEPMHLGRGKIRVGDTVWLVTGPDLPKGASVRVTGADSSILRVEPVASTTD
jgi:membrane protein implicated in regulation of membrane protease activity